MAQDANEEWEVISVYTRADAIADGTLLDVTETAREAGFRAPVALTHRVWEDCVAGNEEDEQRKRIVQDQSGRLWDVLWMASIAARVNRNKNLAKFVVLRVPRARDGIKPKAVCLELVCGPGDDGEIVFTIQFPGED